MAKRLLLLFAVLLGADFYFYQAVKTVSPEGPYLWTYWLIDFLLLSGIITIALQRRGAELQQKLIATLMSFMLLVFVPRLFAMPLLLAEDLWRLFHGFPARVLWLSESAMGMAALLFLLVLFGLTRGRHYYQIKQKTLYFNDLPETFDGLTISQISDVHAGSFTDAAGVQKGLDMINKAGSDLILFTGDMVNNRASEMDPWIPAFAALKAPMGKFSILGNHDYGDYVSWNSAREKQENLNRLKQIHAETGFQLLLNESQVLSREGQSITLMGVENWGKGGFHKYGDLEKTLAPVHEPSFKILMSHDPSHWDAVVLTQKRTIRLTLSGHTHGMQFGIDFLGIKWSPIQYVYKQWSGLYEKSERFLYVNRGFGFLGLKGRVGMWPEITVLTLKRRLSETQTGNTNRHTR